MIKRLLFTFFALLCATGLVWADTQMMLGTPQTRAVRSFTVQPAPSPTCGGGAVSVPVTIDVSDNLIAFQFKLYYDPTLVTPGIPTPGALFAAWAFGPSAPLTDGFGTYVPIAAAGAPVAVGTDENLVLIPFTAIATACDGSSTNLSFLDPTGQLYSTNAGETDVTPSTVPGTLTVTCPGNLPIGAVTNTSPADTATNVAVTAVLDWQDTPNADTWDVYLSSFSPPLFVGTVSASTYDPPGDLTNGITYHWYVVAYSSANDCAAVTGPEWSFTTIAAAAPDVQYDSQSFTDTCSLGGAGDNNGSADPGETIDLTVTLINNGAANATGVAGTLSSITPGISVTTPNANFPDLASGGGTGASSTAFVFDIAGTVACGTMIDFSLDVTANAGAYTNTVTFQVEVGSTTAVILDEAFESWPPAGWTIVNNGGDCVWDSNTNTGRTNYTGGSGLCADADSDDCGNGTTMDTELRTPALDLTTATAASLDFQAAYNDFSANDAFEVDISTNGGISWTNLLTWTADHSAYGPGELVSLDLTPYVSNTVLIRFHYYTTSWDYYAEVDDVMVTVTSATPVCIDCVACTPPAAFTLASPANGAIDQATTTTLSWNASTGATNYNVYFGTVSPPPMVGTVAGTTYDPGPLANSTTYYWTVVATNGCAPDANTAEWSFTTIAPCTPPGAFTLTAPANGAIDQPTTTTLSWGASAAATGYDVYFGTVSPPPMVGTVAGTTYDPGPLANSTTYYWTVVATNGCPPDAITPEWSFTTIAAPVGPTTLTVVNSAGSCGTTVSVPITLDEGDGMLAFQFDLYFDPTYITGVSAAPAGIASGFTVMSNVYADHISVAAASGTALGAGGGTIATVDLLISFATPDGTVTNLDLQNSLVNDVAMTEVDGTLTVSCLPPILAYNDAALRDVCIFGGIGNNDGVADPGEYLYLTVTLINNGPGDATGVSAVMSTATPGATVMMNTSTYPDIPASGGTAQSNSEYMVMVDETFTCGDVIVLDLTITATEGSWTDSFNVPTGAKKRQVILLSEEFETWPPAGWQNNNLGGDCVWDTTANTGGYLSGGNETGGTGEAADANSDDCGNGTTMDTELVTPSIDLTAATTGYLEYNCFFQDMAGLGDAWTDISTDGGTTWTNLVYETTDDASGHLVHVDLTPYVGNTILIRFRYASTGWGWNWEVDSVLVDADAGGGGGGTCNVCAGAPCTPVDQFTNVSPEDGAEGVEPPVTLVWEPAANATYYEVYVGTTPMGVAYVGTTTDTTYTLTDLEAGTTYYWIVSAFNDCSFKNGPRWNFTTSGGAAPTGATDVFVAAAAETSGSRGTHWQTDIRMLNPMDHTIAYSITFIPSDTDGMTSPYVYNGTIPTHEEMMMDNMLTNMFGVSNMAGALHVTSDDPVYVTTRTYTTSDTGSYGQFIPAVSKSMALNMPSPARAQHAKARQADSAHLVMLSSTETRRTNVGFVEVTGQAATANVTLYDDQNNYLGSGAYPLYPMGHFQVDIFNDLGITDEVPVARAEVTVTGAGAILAYASMIDQDSGDAVYIPAQIFDAEDMKKLIVPVAAKAAGANDTSWRTELRIFNPADTAQDVTVTYTTGATSLAANISLESKKVYMSENFLQQLFTLVGDTYGVLTLTSPSGVVAMSRTYTTADVGSYGQGVMPTMADESFKSGTMGYLIHLTQNEDFRSNLGFSEIGLGDAVILIELFDHDGTYLGSYGFGMGIHENRQFNEIVRIIYGDELLNNGYIRFTVVSGQGQVLPYLSVVDNLSGDAIFVTP